MNIVTKTLGCSKQAASQYRRRRRTPLRRAVAEAAFTALLPKIDAVRAKHRKLGCRKLHALLAPANIGRDVFERFAFLHGYRVVRTRSKIRTTHGDRSAQKINIIAGMEVTGVNQVWQGDITYIFWRGRAHYLTEFIDVYSRRVVGFRLSTTLEAIHTVEALGDAFKARGITVRSYLVVHTDAGIQYTSLLYRDKIDDHRCYRSFAETALENAYVERLHSTIKNEYLFDIQAKTEEELVALVAASIAAYNNERPHASLGKMSPVAFEAWVETLPADQRPIVRIYDYEAERRNAAATTEEKTASRVKKRKQGRSELEADAVVSNPHVAPDKGARQDEKTTRRMSMRTTEARVETLREDRRRIVRNDNDEAAQRNVAATTEENTASRVKKQKQEPSELKADAVVSRPRVDSNQDENQDEELTTGLH